MKRRCGPSSTAPRPVGRRVGIGRTGIEIIGVVSNTRYRDRRTEIQPVLFDSALQRAGYGGHHVALRTTAALATLEPEIRRTVASVNRQLPVPDLRTQTAEMDETTGRERVFTQVLSVFGGFALLLASIGLYGVTAYSVARRTEKSACAWRSVRSRGRCCGCSCVRLDGLLSSASRSAFRLPWRMGASSARCSSVFLHRTPC